MASQTTASSTSVKSSVLSEIQEQENRKTNLVVYSLTESNAEEGNDRKAHDLSEIGSLLQESILPSSVKDDIAVIRRLGKRLEDAESQQGAAEPVSSPPKPRPLLVSFKSPQSRKDILSNAKNLAEGPLRHVSICPDLTKNQQKEDRQLRDEVQQLNSENPSDEKGAFLWKVVGTPGQQNRRKVKIYPRKPTEIIASASCIPMRRQL